jgi:hypothetical protein
VRALAFERRIFAVRLAVKVVERILDHVQDIEPGVGKLGQPAGVGKSVCRIVREVCGKEYVSIFGTGLSPTLSASSARRAAGGRRRIARDENYFVCHVNHQDEKAGCPPESSRLYQMLANPIYVGEIRHKQVSHPGQHEPIIERSLWQRVQELLKQRSARPRGDATRRTTGLLTDKLFDENGEPLYACGAKKRKIGVEMRYRWSATTGGLSWAT